MYPFLLPPQPLPRGQRPLRRAPVPTRTSLCGDWCLFSQHCCLSQYPSIPGLDTRTLLTSEDLHSKPFTWLTQARRNGTDVTLSGNHLHLLCLLWWSAVCKGRWLLTFCLVVIELDVRDHSQTPAVGGRLEHADVRRKRGKDVGMKSRSHRKPPVLCDPLGDEHMPEVKLWWREDGYSFRRDGNVRDLRIGRVDGFQNGITTRCVGVAEASKLAGSIPEAARQRDRRRRERLRGARKADSLLFVNGALHANDRGVRRVAGNSYAGSPTEIPVMISPVMGSPKAGQHKSHDRGQKGRSEGGQSFRRKIKPVFLSVGEFGLAEASRDHMDAGLAEASRDRIDAEALLSRVREANCVAKQRPATPRYAPALCLPFANDVEEPYCGGMTNFEFTQSQQSSHIAVESSTKAARRDARDDDLFPRLRSPIGGWDTRSASRGETPAGVPGFFRGGEAPLRGARETQEFREGRESFENMESRTPATRLATLRDLLSQGLFPPDDFFMISN